MGKEIMADINYKIILPTNIKYLDITHNFIELLKITWPEAIKNLVISVTGQEKDKSISVGNIPVVLNESTSSLPTCIYNAAQDNPAEYYLIFLGDAFISKRIDNRKIDLLLKRLIENSINYCRLLPQFSLYRKGRVKEYRKLNSDERYGHSFVAFGASFEFIKSEFANDITDRQFELIYLELASKKKNIYFPDRVVLRQNMFHILPSIQKGKWDRINILYLKRKYPQINFSNREVISLKCESILLIRKAILPFISDSLRLRLKANKRKYFDTDL